MPTVAVLLIAATIVCIVIAVFAEAERERPADEYVRLRVAFY